MYQEVTLRGIVLSSSQVGDYDRRLVLLTADRGRVTVFANGARRQNSKFSAASQNYVMGKYVVREGRDSYTLISTEIEESFRELSEDICNMCYAAYFCELVSYFTREGLRAGNELNLLYLAFKLLLNDSISNKFIKMVFEQKMLFIEGQSLNVYECICCKKRDSKLIKVSYSSGGCLCENCITEKRAEGRYRYESISNSALYTMQYINSSPVIKVFNFKLTDNVEAEMIKIVNKSIESNIDRKFKSLEILDSLL